MVAALDLGSSVLSGVRVRVSPPVPNKLGSSQVDKARGFDPLMREFESHLPCHNKR